MAKVVGVVGVVGVDLAEFKDKISGEVKMMARVSGFGDDKQLYAFYRPAEENPQEGDTYQLILQADSKFKPVIKFLKEK